MNYARNVHRRRQKKLEAPEQMIRQIQRGADRGTRHHTSAPGCGRGLRLVVNLWWYGAADRCGWIGRKLVRAARRPTEAKRRHASCVDQPWAQRCPPGASLLATPWHLQSPPGHVHRSVLVCYHQDPGALPQGGTQRHRSSQRCAGSVAESGGRLDSRRRSRPNARTGFGSDHRPCTIGFRMVNALVQVA